MHRIDQQRHPPRKGFAVARPLGRPGPVDMRLERRRALADVQHLLGQPVRRPARRLDRARRDILDIAKLIDDAFADRPLERRPRRYGQPLGTLGDDPGDRFTRPLCGMSRRFAHLDHRGDQGRAGFAAQSCRFGVGGSDRRGQRRQLGACAVDPLVDARQKRGKAVLLRIDAGPARGDSLAGFDRRLAHPLDLGPRALCRRKHPSCAGLGVAKSSGQPLAHFARQRCNAFAQRCGAVGQRLDRAIAAARLLGQCAQLCPHPAKRAAHRRRPRIAIDGEQRKAFVERRQPEIEIGDHPLGIAFLLGDPRRQGVKRRTGPADMTAKRRRGLDPGATDPGRCSIDQRRHRDRLRVDPRSDGFERSGSPLKHSINHLR